MPSEMFPTPIRTTCHGFSAAAGNAGAAIGSFGFSILVSNESFGYSGAFYTFAAITLILIPLTWFCMFDNDQSLDEMDEQFYARLNGEDEVTRESFTKSNDIEMDASYKGSCPPVV